MNAFHTMVYDFVGHRVLISYHAAPPTSLPAMSHQIEPYGTTRANFAAGHHSQISRPRRRRRRLADAMRIVR